MTPWEMKTRKYLNIVEKQNQLVKHLQQEMKQAEELIYSVGSPGNNEKVQTSASADRTLEQLVELEKKREELAVACNAYMDFRIKVTEQIHKLPNENQKMVLYQHYLQFKSFRTLEEEKNFCYAYVTQLHREGIRSFWRLNKEIIEKMLKQSVS